MNKHFFCFILSFLFINSVFAQKKAEPTIDEKQYAKTLKKKFPNDNIALKESKDVFTFSFDKKNEKVTANHLLNETLINIDSRSDIQLYSFYDEQSVINEFNINLKKQQTFILKMKLIAATTYFTKIRV